MIKRSIITIISLLMVTFLASGCAKDVATSESTPVQQTESGTTQSEPEKNTDDSKTESESEKNTDDSKTESDPVKNTDDGKTQSVPTQPSDAYNTSFSRMPEISCENVTVYASGDVALFEFINPGLDSFSAELVSYSLSKDNVLGRVNLGEGNFQISLTDDGFIVANLMKNTADYYDFSCKKTDSQTVFRNNMLSFVEFSADGRFILAQNYNRELLVYNGKTKNVSTLKKGKTFEKAKYQNGKFYLLGAGAAILEPENNHYYGISDVVRTYGAAGDYAVGINGSYLACLSAKGENHKMINIGERAGYLVDAGDYGCVVIDDSGNKTKVLFYDINNSRVAKYTQKDRIISVKQISEDFAVTVSKNAENLLKFKLLKLSDLKKSSFKAEALNTDKMNGAVELPDYSGESKTVRLIKQLEKDYGVRVMFGEDIFNMSEFGFDISGTDEKTAYKYMLKLGDYFDYYPKGLLKEAGLGRPLVLYLCDSIRNNVEGLSIYIGGYNVIYMQTGGKDEYFLSSLTHEVGHALENGISTELISGWTELMPKSVVKAYGDGIEGISVEYTADDKGKTPVWFTDVYGRSNEKEDRATVFQKMYDSYISKEVGLFSYDGLKKKADYWSYMLRESYDSCKKADKINWES